jgi:hypothetical protein
MSDWMKTYKIQCYRGDGWHNYRDDVGDDIEFLSLASASKVAEDVFWYFVYDDDGAKKRIVWDEYRIVSSTGQYFPSVHGKENANVVWE